MSKIAYHGQDLPVVTLRPGELHVARTPTMISTLLGSCVSVCLYNPKARTGGMCHGVLPFFDDASGKDPFRFVDSSIAYMVDVLAGQHGLPGSVLNAKLFGGADVLNFKGFAAFSQPSIGAQNIVAARQALERWGVTISTERVGGSHGLKLIFFTHTGEVFLKSLSGGMVRRR